MGRDSIQMTQLVDTHPQRGPHFGIEPVSGPAGPSLDQKVELRLPPQAPKNDFVCQAGIAGIKRF
jgi:hypothetical protein